MRLLEIKIKNFMPYKGEHKIAFPASSQENVILLFGDNMRGKTSFLNAIRWCFYGKAMARHLREIPNYDIVNIDAAKENDWHTSVHIRFESDGHEYDLHRDIEKKRLVHIPKNSNDLDSIVMLRKDGNVLTSDKVPHELNQIIPEDIARFFLFDGELLQEYEMLLDDQNDQGRLIKESIEKILGVPALINARNEIDNLLNEARKIYARETRHISGLELQSTELSKLQSEKASLESDLLDLQNQHSMHQVEIDAIEEELEKTQSIQSNKDKLDSNQSRLKDLEKEQETLEEEKLSLLKEAWKDLVQPRLQAYISGLEAKRIAHDDEQRQKFTIENRIENLESILSNALCPTCEQTIEPAKREVIGKELGKLQVDLNEFKDNRLITDNISEQILRLGRIRKSLASERIPNIETRLRSISLAMTEIDNENEELDQKLRQHDTAEIARKRSKKDNLLKAIGKIEDNIKDRRTKIEDNDRKQGDLTKLIDSNAQGRAQKSAKMVHAYTELKNVFSESIDSLRENLRTNVAELASIAFKKLTTEETYSGLKINENYGLTIVDREGRDVTQRSAGAEQIVALALIDGLNNTARKSGPIIMDTPLGRLDLKHRYNVLKYIPQMADQVILLVHEGEIRKEDIIDSLKTKIAGMYNIERISSSESRIVRV